MLTLMTRSKVVGWYGATTSLFISLSFLPSLVGTAWLPRLVASFSHGHRNLVKTARTPIEFIFVISVPVAAGTAMVAGPLIHTIYGPAFGPAVPVMIILAACIPSGYLNIILVQVLVAAKRQAIWSWVMVVAAVINPAMNLILIPLTESRYHNGAIGAAISLLLTEGLMTVVGFVLVGQHVFDRRAIKRCLLATGASAAMLAVAYVARPLGTLESLAAGSATLVLLTVALRIATPDEVALMRSGIARIRRAGGGRLARKRMTAMSQGDA
jgi:O-antigen/teichoic acid export membrane protein